jgi:hypothetical protein
MVAVLMAVALGANAPSKPRFEVVITADQKDFHGTTQRVTRLPLEGDLKVYTPELGEKIVSMRLVGPKDELARMAVRHQARSTLVVQGEGPVCPLENWRHGLSEWAEVPFQNDGTLQLGKEPKVPFPHVSRAEIDAAVRAECRWDEGWIKLAEKCTTASTYPCNTPTDRERYEVVLKATGGTTIVGTIDVRHPVGC